MGVGFNLRSVALFFLKCKAYRSLEATDLFLGQIAKLPSCKQVEDQRVKVLLGIVGKKSPWDAEAAAMAFQSINGCKHLSKASKNALLKEVTLELGDGGGSASIELL